MKTYRTRLTSGLFIASYSAHMRIQIPSDNPPIHYVLRTHVGGPVQSFSAIDRMLQAACARLLLQGASSSSDATGTPHSDPLGSAPPPGPSAVSSGPTSAVTSAGVTRTGGTVGGMQQQQQPTAVPQQQLRESTWLLLEMVGALERALHHACQGGLHQPQLPRGALAFFAANR